MFDQFHIHFCLQIWSDTRAKISKNKKSTRRTVCCSIATQLIIMRILQCSKPNSSILEQQINLYRPRFQNHSLSYTFRTTPLILSPPYNIRIKNIVPSTYSLIRNGHNININFKINFIFAIIKQTWKMNNLLIRVCKGVHMSKILWKPGTMVYPVPAVMVTCGTMETPNIITIAWTGTICTDPAMTYISVRKERHSYNMIKESGEFVINLTTKDLVKATDFCGVKSGRDHDKFKLMNLTPVKGAYIEAPLIAESPVNIECKVTQILELGSHDMFLAKVLGVTIEDTLIDHTGKFRLDLANPISYAHGAYYSLGEQLGTFGYSIMKKKTLQKKKTQKKSAAKK